VPGDDARRRLGEAQAALLAALLGRGPLPPGFDAGRVGATARALTAKRQHGVARTWPALARGLGEGLGGALAEYAAHAPHPHPGGPWADGWGLARWLAARGRLPEGARGELLRAELRAHLRPDAVVVRRLPSVRLGRLAGPRPWVLALRLGGREAWLPLPWPRGGR
jgi:hypothetical protein